MENSQTSVFKNWTARLQLNDWSFLRIARLVIGAVILFEAFPQGEWLFILFGGFFLYQGIVNQKCGGGSCEIPPK